jgi:hypothetical protein
MMIGLIKEELSSDVHGEAGGGGGIRGDPSVRRKLKERIGGKDGASGGSGGGGGGGGGGPGRPPVPASRPSVGGRPPPSRPLPPRIGSASSDTSSTLSSSGTFDAYGSDDDDNGNRDGHGAKRGGDDDGFGRATSGVR